MPNKIAVVTWAVVTAVAVLVGHYAFAFATGTRFATDQWSAAGAWASAIGATLLAAASVWLAMQAQQHARQAEQRAKDDAKATQDRHDRELAEAEARLDRQIEAEWQREQMRVIAAIWDTMTKFIEPTNELRRRAEEYVEHQTVERARALVNTYANWKFAMFEVRSTFTPADMMVDDESLRKQLARMKFKLMQLEELGKSIKNAALDNEGADMGRQFTLDLNDILQMRGPMTKQVRSILRAKPEAIPETQVPSPQDS